MSKSTESSAEQPKPLDIEDLLQRLEESGKTAAFARDHGVPAWKLFYALKSRVKKSPALMPVVAT